MTDKRIRMDCPFCHTPPERIEVMLIGSQKSRHRIWFVSCPECGVQTRHSESRQEAINAWNRR